MVVKSMLFIMRHWREGSYYSVLCFGVGCQGVQLMQVIMSNSHSLTLSITNKVQQFTTCKYIQVRYILITVRRLYSALFCHYIVLSLSQYMILCGCGFLRVSISFDDSLCMHLRHIEHDYFKTVLRIPLLQKQQCTRFTVQPRYMHLKKKP